MHEVVDLLIVMPELFWGGAEKQFRFMVEDFCCKDYKIIVLIEHAYGASKSKDEFDFIENCPNIIFEELSLYGLDNINAGFSLYKKCIPIFKRYKIKNAIIYDVKGLMLLPLMRLFGINIIYSERNEGVWICNKKITNFLITYFADVLTANSTFATDVLRKKFPQNVNYIPNAVDVNEIDIVPSKMCKIILIPARIHPVKNQKLILDFLRECSTFNGIIYFAGKIADKAYYEMLVDYVKENNLGERVKYLGFVSDIGKLYNKVDLVILPSFSEGTSNVILESLAKGMPILVSNIEQNVITRQLAEYSFSPNSVEELNASYTRFTSLSKFEQTEIIKNNYNFIRDNYSRTKLLKAYESLLI